MDNTGSTKGPSLKIDKSIALLLLAVFLAVFFMWGWFAELDTAAIAPGKLDVASRKKLIQHQTGGIIHEVYVNEGDVVDTGQLLIDLDHTQTLSSLALLKGQEASLLLTKLRLEAALKGEKTLTPPNWLSRQDGVVIDLSDTYQKIFHTQKNVLVSEAEAHQAEVLTLVRQVKQLKSQINAANIELDSAITQEELIKEELDAVVILEEKKLVRKPRLLALKREASKLQASRETLKSRIIELMDKKEEVQARLVALKTNRKKTLLEELSTIQSQLSDIKNKIINAEKNYQLTKIYTPTTGRVVGLLYHTKGEVVKPGETIMQIVPKDDQLVVEARLNPTDIDRVTPGMKAKVRFTAFNPNLYAPVDGVVETVSADVAQDETTGQSYYSVRIVLNEDPMLQKAELVQGMATEVMIISDRQTPLEYIITPFKYSFNRAFKED